VTPPRDRDVNFRHAIRAAWPNVGGIQHRLDRYLSMDYDDMDWAVPSPTHKGYAKTHARWEQIEKEKEAFREAHDLNDQCLPNHAPLHWRTGEPLPREWERSRRNEATEEDLMWTQGTPLVYTEQQKAAYDAHLLRQNRGKSGSDANSSRGGQDSGSQTRASGQRTRSPHHMHPFFWGMGWA